MLNVAQRRRLRKRLGRVVVEEVGDVRLVVLPAVFNPAVFRTGTFLAETLAKLAPTDSRAGERPTALDMGTGSGVGAVFAARHGYDVTAVDINPDAVRCARINSLLNGVEERVEVRCGDLFEPLDGRLFDLVLFNPPFFRGDPQDPLDAAWRGRDVIERFAEGLPEVQKLGGRALILLSSHGEEQAMLDGLRRAGLEVEPFARRDFGNELLTVYCARDPRAPLGEVVPEQAGTGQTAGQMR